MKDQTSKRIRLGIFVVIATLCLILGLYFIGVKRNVFQSSISVSAVFKNINGLIPGNNVQFNGINVGTVSKVLAIADTAIRVEFSIDEDVLPYITVYAIAAIGTDGLLGNKLVTLTPDKKGGKPIADGDVMLTSEPLAIDKALEKLIVTNDNLSVISDNLATFSEGFTNKQSFWQLMNDSAISQNIRSTLINIKLTSSNSAIITGNLSALVKDVQAGKGTLGALITDTTMSRQLKQSIVNIESITDSFAIITGNFKQFSQSINSSKGALGTLISDTNFVHTLNASMLNIKNGSGNFNDNMIALKHTWPLKKYFKKSETKK